MVATSVASEQTNREGTLLSKKRMEEEGMAMKVFPLVMPVFSKDLPSSLLDKETDKPESSKDWQSESKESVEEELKEGVKEE